MSLPGPTVRADIARSPMVCLNMLHITLTAFSVRSRFCVVHSPHPASSAHAPTPDKSVFRLRELRHQLHRPVRLPLSPAPASGRRVCLRLTISLLHRISSLLVCHFLLALQEAKQQPTDSALSSVKLSMPYFDPSTLPRFVEPLGGLVHATFELEGAGSPGAA